MRRSGKVLLPTLISRSYCLKPTAYTESLYFPGVSLSKLKKPVSSVEVAATSKPSVRCKFTLAPAIAANAGSRVLPEML